MSNIVESIEIYANQIEENSSHINIDLTQGFNYAKQEMHNKLTSEFLGINMMTSGYTYSILTYSTNNNSINIQLVRDNIQHPIYLNININGNNEKLRLLNLYSLAKLVGRIDIPYHDSPYYKTYILDNYSNAEIIVNDNESLFIYFYIKLNK